MAGFLDMLTQCDCSAGGGADWQAVSLDGGVAGLNTGESHAAAFGSGPDSAIGRGSR